MIRCLIIITFVFISCNEWIFDVKHPTDVPQEVVLSTPEGVRGLRASMYLKINNSFNFTTDYFVGPSAFADETRVRPGGGRMSGYNEAHGDDGGIIHIGGWRDTYSILLDANLLIGAVTEDVFGDGGVTLNRYRGEALAIRALVMHHLVRTVGYDPTNPFIAQWNLGIILRTNPILNETYVGLKPRSTVEGVYEQILSDLAEAKLLLSGINEPNYYPSEAFVDGLTARIQLYAGNWEAAYNAALNAISNFPGDLIRTEGGVTNMFYEGEDGGNHPEALWKLVVNPRPLPIAGWPTTPAVYTSAPLYQQIPTQMVIDLYEEGDYRLGWYRECPTSHYSNICISVNDKGWYIAKYSGGRGNFADDLPYMRISEVYLIAAEAAARLAGPNAGLPYLNELRAARNVGPINDAILSSMEAFENEILNERVRELVVEGHRFYDLKRLGRDILHPDSSMKIRNDSYRMLAPIPFDQVSMNPHLIQNPGY